VNEKDTRQFKAILFLIAGALVLNAISIKNNITGLRATISAEVQKVMRCEK